jgi:hypothetical protein
MLHTTLKLGSDLQMFDPRKPASKNRDIYDESSYEKVDIRFSKLTPMVLAVREKLRKAIVKVFLDEADRLPGMEYYTADAVFAGTEAKVKQLMRQVLAGENERGQHASTGDPGCIGGEAIAKLDKKRKQSLLTFSGDSSAGGAAVMSVMEEANVPSTPEVADNVRMEEMVSEQFESYKRTASKTLNAVNAPLSSTEQTCSVSDPDEWWSRNRTQAGEN